MLVTNANKKQACQLNIGTLYQLIVAVSKLFLVPSCTSEKKAYEIYSIGRLLVDFLAK